MVKFIYKTVALFFIFAGALFFFGKQMETNINDSGTRVGLASETYPHIQLGTQGQKVNPMYGYSAPMEADIIRESMTPLDQDKKLTVYLGESSSRLTSLRYEISDKETGEIYETGESNALSADQKKLDLTFNYGFKTSMEYILDLIGTSDQGREIHYYTRLKYYLDDSHLAEKMRFVKKFHKNSFVKSKADDLGKYLEPNSTNRNSTLASVDITSNTDLVTWGNMSPSVISDEMITMKEYNMETACVQYNYFVKANTDSGEETYHVKEFYRVRYASGTDYLLNFERTMEAVFDPGLASVQTSQFKLGITNENSDRIFTNKKEDTMYFARGGNLYRYNMKENRIMKLYSMFSDEASYTCRAYDEHAIRLLKVDEEGNLYFCAYGYFPRGEYEGDVAVVLYEYTVEGDLRELVYMPSSTTYQQLKEDFEEYGYVSSRGIYYFTVANTVYAYNISAKRLEKLVENIKSNSFMTMENANCYAWSSSLSSGYGESITLYNLETDEKAVIYRPDENTYVRLLGVIDENVVYGFVHKKDIGRSVDGSRVVPCYKLYIADTKGKTVKEFAWKGRYIQGIRANGNVINITLCKKDRAGRYVKSAENSISNQSQMKTSKFRYTSRVTNKSLTEWYIQMPSSFEMPHKPETIPGPVSLTTTQRFVRLEQPGVTKYYVYALGKITESHESARQAIRAADQQMGVVISSNHQVVWERSGSFLQNSIGGLEMTRKGNGVSNLAACAYMVLKQKHINVDAKELTKKELPVYDMLAKYMNRPVNLKGCTLEQVLYFVSNNKPVIAMTDNNKAVVIGGYTTTQLYLYNPETGREATVNRSEYETIFKNAGNQFISYME